MTKRPVIPMALLFVGIALCGLVWFGLRPLSRSELAKGIITDVVPAPQRKGPRLYRFQVEYRDQTGTKFQYLTEQSLPLDYSIGQPVTVYYNKDNPSFCCLGEERANSIHGRLVAMAIIGMIYLIGIHIVRQQMLK